MDNEQNKALAGEQQVPEVDRVTRVFDLFVDMATAAKMKNVQKVTILAAVQRGKIRGRLFGTSWVLFKPDVEALRTKRSPKTIYRRKKWEMRLASRGARPHEARNWSLREQRNS